LLGILRPVLGGRSTAFVARQALEARNHVSLARIFRVCEQPLDFAHRYFTDSGDYPTTARVRTPLGVVAPSAYTHHDIWMINEVFCPLDYKLPVSARVVVDIGSNIGISALYLLTRGPEVRCHLFEPDPRNADRLEHNLASTPRVTSSRSRTRSRSPAGTSTRSSRRCSRCPSPWRPRASSARRGSAGARRRRGGAQHAVGGAS
jgi:hypothetical protein